MPLPCYQYIKIQSHDPRIINGQLSNLVFNRVPLVLEIDHLGQMQFDCLMIIENFVIKNHIKKLPYSVYIVTTCTQYDGQLYTVKSKSELPQFFNKKNKTLNSKEVQYLNKIELKQANFKGLVESEYMSALNRYANGHRRISQKQNFLVYLETINKGLKDYYGQKEQKNS